MYLYAHFPTFVFSLYVATGVFIGDTKWSPSKLCEHKKTRVETERCTQSFERNLAPLGGGENYTDSRRCHINENNFATETTWRCKFTYASARYSKVDLRLPQLAVSDF
jgi:hypothetical protein